MLLIDIAVGENDVVVAFIDTAFGILTELIERIAQPFLALTS